MMFDSLPDGISQFRFSEEQRSTLENIVCMHNGAGEFIKRVENMVSYCQEERRKRPSNQKLIQEEMAKVNKQASKLFETLLSLDKETQRELNYYCKQKFPIPEELTRIRPRWNPGSNESLHEYTQKLEEQVDSLKNHGGNQVIQSIARLCQATGSFFESKTRPNKNIERIWLIYIVIGEYSELIGELYPETLKEGSGPDKIIALAIDAAGWRATFPNRKKYFDETRNMLLQTRYAEIYSLDNLDYDPEVTTDPQGFLSKPWG